MGAKASTPATSGHQSPRARTFSTSSTGTDVVVATSAPSSAGIGGPGGAGTQGFNLLRALPGLQVHHNHHHNHHNAQNTSSIDRQRARSLSSVPDLHQPGGAHPQPGAPHTHPATAAGTNNNSFSGSTSSSNNNNSSNSHNHNHQMHSHHPLGGGIRMGVPVGSGSFHGHPLMMNGSGGGLMPHLNYDHFEEVAMTGAGFADGIAVAAAAAAAASSSGTSMNGIGRVYTATSLPSNIWSLNGIKCPVCSKFVLPDDIECHLVMCLTKPRLSYNEDVLTDAKGECVICLEDLNPGDVIARLPCLCIYHKGCIDRWFEVNRSCPEHPGD